MVFHFIYKSIISLEEKLIKHCDSFQFIESLTVINNKCNMNKNIEG